MLAGAEEAGPRGNGLEVPRECGLEVKRLPGSWAWRAWRVRGLGFSLEVTSRIRPGDDLEMLRLRRLRDATVKELEARTSRYYCDGDGARGQARDATVKETELEARAAHTHAHECASWGCGCWLGPNTVYCKQYTVYCILYIVNSIL